MLRVEGKEKSGAWAEGEGVSVEERGVGEHRRGVSQTFQGHPVKEGKAVKE